MIGARIIVVDNDAGIREFLTFSLEDENYQVFSYSYAGINLAALEQLKPDLIILDFSIRASGTGWAFLQILKMEDATANIPVLITTTLDDFPAEIRGYLLARYIQVLYKPFGLHALTQLVKETLNLASRAGTLFSSDSSLPILVVDDTEGLREAVTTILTLEGYQVVTADNGQRALDAVSRTDHCLILLDIAMPIMDGFEFLRAYDRQLRPHTPVVIISGEEDVQTRVLPSFVIDILPKPFEIRPLLKLVATYALPL